MMKKISGFVLLVVMMICSVSLSVTYSKYLISKSVVGEVMTKANCLDMGLTFLGECMLVMDSNVNNVESAKLYISSKEADLTKMAPTINYAEKSELVSNVNGVYSSYRSFYLATSYTFDSSTGIYTLGADYVIDVLADKYIDYYTCDGYALQCSKMHQIKDYVAYIYDASRRDVITSAVVYTYNTTDSFDSEIGLYAAEDDYGTSYYYRGNVKNNYVSYAGYIWRIVRQNGDGSIRLIYSGDDTSDTGSDTFIDSVDFRPSTKADPTYSGYMYNEDFKIFTNDAYTTGFVGFSDNAKMYFADSYEFDEDTKTFNLKGNYLYGTWKDNYDEIIANYPYTCRSSISETATCYFVVHAKSYKNDTTINANLITYSSKSYESSIKNVTDSVLKKNVETWYESNILNSQDSDNNFYSDYLSDEIFCNDRTFYSGNGYVASSYTVYSAHKRLYVEKKPSFMCNQDNDKFTYVSSNGNGMLNYPIGLLTVDEAFYAGSPIYAVNSNNYLNVGEAYWTMTPFNYDSAWAVNRLWYVDLTGGVYATFVGKLYGVRPVINLRSDIKITSGDGTVESPYVVKL